MNDLSLSVAYPCNQTLSSVREGAGFLCLSQVPVAGSGPGTSCSPGKQWSPWSSSSSWKLLPSIEHMLFSFTFKSQNNPKYYYRCCLLLPSLLHMRKLCFRENKSFSQGHTEHSGLYSTLVNYSGQIDFVKHSHGVDKWGKCVLPPGGCSPLDMKLGQGTLVRCQPPLSGDLLWSTPPAQSYVQIHKSLISNPMVWPFQPLEMVSDNDSCLSLK